MQACTRFKHARAYVCVHVIEVRLCVCEWLKHVCTSVYGRAYIKCLTTITTTTTTTTYSKLLIPCEVTKLSAAFWQMCDSGIELQCAGPVPKAKRAGKAITISEAKECDEQLERACTAGVGREWGRCACVRTFCSYELMQVKERGKRKGVSATFDGVVSKLS